MIAFLVTLGFSEIPNDTCVMYLTAGTEIALSSAFMWMTDLLLFTTTEALVDDITQKLQARFQGNYLVSRYAYQHLR
jgi:hypothetical protein